MRLGLSFDLETLDPDTRVALSKERNSRFLSGPMLNSYAMLLKVLNANAVIGLVVTDSNHDGRIDLESGDELGISCGLRGPNAPHPFYVPDSVRRAELVAFLQRLDDTRK